MDQLKVLRLYMASKLHFTNKKYDIFESKAAVKNINITTYQSNKARKLLVDRLAKRFKTPGEVLGYIVPQWVYSNGTSLFDMMEAEENYAKWQKFRAGSTHLIVDDLYHYDVKKIIMGSEPEIFKLVLQNKVHIESAIALDKVINFIDLSTDYFVFSQLALTIKKSSGFINFDIEKVKTELHI